MEKSTPGSKKPSAKPKERGERKSVNPEFHKKQLSKYSKAREALEKLILKNYGEKDLPDRVNVYLHIDRGVRVSEVSVVWDRGTGVAGISWIRCECPRIILAAEEFILTFGTKAWRPPGWESDIDDHADATFRLLEILKEE